MELTLLLKYWQQILLGGTAIVLGVSLMVTRHTLAGRTESLHNLTVAAKNFQDSVSIATAKAKADDTAHALAVHEADENIRTKNETTLKAKLADADKLANAYALRLRSASSANPSGVRDKGLPEATDSSEPATSPGTDPELDDARVCARNTVLAQGWQDWWNDVNGVDSR